MVTVLGFLSLMSLRIFEASNQRCSCASMSERMVLAERGLSTSWRSFGRTASTSAGDGGNKIPVDDLRGRGHENLRHGSRPQVWSVLGRDGILPPEVSVALRVFVAHGRPRSTRGS